MGRVSLYFVFKPPTGFIFKNINTEPICMFRCGFQNDGLKYNTPLRTECYHGYGQMNIIKTPGNEPTMIVVGV